MSVPDSAATESPVPDAAAPGPPLTPAELTRAVEELLALQVALREQVEALADRAGRSNGPTVFRWTDLPASTAGSAWSGLRDWTDWLTARHQVREVPRGCWWRHGFVVEELTALWWAWQAAYAEDADPSSPLAWLEHLDRARERLRTRLTLQGTCLAGEHSEATPTLATDAGRSGFSDFVAADLAARADRLDTAAGGPAAVG